MKWMVGEAALDDVQLGVIDEIVENFDGNHWVKGFPGTGKTIVLTHVVNRLATQRPRPSIAFVTYTHSLKQMVESGLSPAAESSVHVSTLTAIKNQRRSFDVIVADEMQDANLADLEGMQRKGDAYVIAADFDQSIYPAAAGSRTLTAAMRPYSEHELLAIYRINQRVYNVATTIYPDAYSPASTTTRRDTSRVKVFRGASARDEFVTMFDEAARLASRGRPSAVLLPTWKLMDKFLSTVAQARRYPGPVLSVVDDKDSPARGEVRDPYRTVNAWLRRARSPLQILGSGAGDIAESSTRKMVYLMTYHSAKGLEFAYVFMPHLTDGTPLFAFKGGDSEDERRIFFVAATRAMQTLHLSYHGDPHPFLDEIETADIQKFTRPKDDF